MFERDADSGLDADADADLDERCLQADHDAHRVWEFSSLAGPRRGLVAVALEADRLIGSGGGFECTHVA